LVSLPVPVSIGAESKPRPSAGRKETAMKQKIVTHLRFDSDPTRAAADGTEVSA
jgi:hypothetical protein